MKRRTALRALAALAAARSVSTLGAAPKVEYPDVVPRTLVFPRDHGAHPAFRIEWWYVTGWLGVRGRARDLGFQITFFRARNEYATDNPSRFTPRQILFAHAAIADPRHGRLQHDQRAARQGLGLAGAEASETGVWIDDWRFAQAAGGYAGEIPARAFTLRLDLATDRTPLLQGGDGVSRKGPRPQEASYYYSRPQLAVRGTLERGDEATSVSGRAWLDHEWSSAYLPPEAEGWDWIGINLDDGGALMAFVMRAKEGGVHYAGGTLAGADGARRVFGPQEVRFEPLRLWRSPRTGVEYPVAMHVTTGERSWTLEPLMDDQELDSRPSTGTIYWEGAVRVSREGREVGRGYLELTGYWKAMAL
ncbi:MAG: lipocalin-like domain-containing protein [Burkholderiales bacterium]|nr:lipocalin-like domain-containing protein [Burkholderiales bacterium]